MSDSEDTRIEVAKAARTLRLGEAKAKAEEDQAEADTGYPAEWREMILSNDDTVVGLGFECGVLDLYLVSLERLEDGHDLMQYGLKARRLTPTEEDFPVVTLRHEVPPRHVPTPPEAP